MKLGMKVGLVPSHIVLDGHPAAFPQKGQSPKFCHGSKCHLVRW